MAGPLLIGLDGISLDAGGREKLCHPDVGGVVLFSRNYESPDQLMELCADIRWAGSARPLICIDQEGGRVQRLRSGFTALPPLGVLGALWRSEPERAAELAWRHARVMAAEMIGAGIDISFTPVLDLDRGSSVIGDRAFAADPAAVTALGRRYLEGMRAAGMKTTGKHFPGHGSVHADSHIDDAVDERELAAIEATDLLPYLSLAAMLDAMMVAHVVYPRVDPLPAGYSRRWLRDYLRGRVGYRGVILSDDLGMHAARIVGDLEARVRACLSAGCDLVLVCRSEDVEELLGRPRAPLGDATAALAALYATPAQDAPLLAGSAAASEWRAWRDSLERLNDLVPTTGA